MTKFYNESRVKHCEKINYNWRKIEIHETPFGGVTAQFYSQFFVFIKLNGFKIDFGDKNFKIDETEVFEFRAFWLKIPQHKLKASNMEDRD